MKAMILSKIRCFYLLLFLFTANLLLSCGGPNESNPSGRYSTTVPRLGSTPKGYLEVELNEDGSCLISHVGHFYGEDGMWKKTENGVEIFGVEGEFSRYNSGYIWVEHNNARGVGNEGMVLQRLSGESISFLFPL